MTFPLICAPVRTPIGRFGGGLQDVRADDLAALVLREVYARTGSPDIDEVILGCANQAGEDNRNIARMGLLLAGLPQSTPGYTVNRLCASGLEAINSAARMIRAGDAERVLAGGVESMSRAPYVMPRGAVAPKFGNFTAFDTSLGWRFPNPKMEALFPLEAMGETAENLAERYGVSRTDQDAFAVESHRRAVAAQSSGSFDAEILPVPRHKQDPLTRDEGPRQDSSLEALAKLKPAFRPGGTVTAGNASTLNDGASAMLITSERAAVTPIARILGCASAGVDPRFMGIGPVPAIRKVLHRAGLRAHDIDLFELNEAFAAQALSVMRELELDPARVNVNGGAIALGHPLGSSGARIVTTLAYALKAQGRRYGIASLCVGVGQGVATLIEAI